MTLAPVLPWWLLALVGGPALGVAIVLAVRHRSRALAWSRRGLMLVLVLLVCLRPGIAGAGEQAPARSTDVDVFFVVDRTMSMAAQDYDGGKERLSGVRSDVMALARQLTGARFSVIEFGRGAQVDLPLTTDTAALRSTMDVLRQESGHYARGTSIDRALPELADALQRARQTRPERARLVYFISDGEQTVDEQPRSFAGLAPHVTGGAVLGYGTPAGGRMPDPDAGDPSAYVTGPDGQTALSRIDEDNLQRIARELGVDYHHRTAPGGLHVDLGQVTVSAAPGGDAARVSTFELYWLLAIGVAALALCELWGLGHLAVASRRVLP